MPPPKKAAKKAAKKAPKHGPKHEHHPHHHKEAKDLRRAYEHMGRVEILQRDLKPAVAEDINTLAALARTELEEGEYKNAADLLLGAEHLCFAALAGDSSRGIELSSELEADITEQFNDLTRKAEDHWEDQGEHPEAMTAIYQNARKSAAKALRQGAHYQALEFVRAAESLAHVKSHGPKKLPGGKPQRKLAV